MNRTIQCTLILISCVAVAACSGSSSMSKSGAKPDSPPELRQFESGAEAMSESPRGVLPQHVPDWSSAQAAYDADLALWSGLKPTLTAVGASATTITEIGNALTAYKVDVTEQNQRAAETDANTITLSVPDLFDLFTYPAPTDTLRLDGTLRQMQIAAEFSDWAEAQDSLDKTKTVWARLEPLVAAQAPKRSDIPGSATVVDDVRANLSTSQTIIVDGGAKQTDSVQLEQQAQAGLDQTDTCEQVFK